MQFHHTMSSLLEHLDVHLKPDSKTSSWHRRFAQNVHKQLTSSPEDQTPTPQNGTCLQAFEWYVNHKSCLDEPDGTARALCSKMILMILGTRPTMARI